MKPATFVVVVVVVIAVRRPTLSDGVFAPTDLAQKSGGAPGGAAVEQVLR
ncbi:MAG: hypothetical protein JRK53_05190 [Deltaproteobacteria bacterium]|nr:hypothetical protein [Deltaproteobacteria bacterium]MBW1817004.1 hypothetical protein [Deltaproteobacteria bacterium]